jgi:cellulose synthase/poly-beta-1,6-N-acetylglucosamine synthase-like glycosyltransferase
MIEALSLTLLLLLANCFLVQLLYQLFMFMRVSLHKPTENKRNDQLQPVTVIISARNEYDNLERHLPHILEQDYPQFEVIVVNDCSWDQTGTLLERLQAQYSHLKIVTIHEQEKYPTGKKFALTLAIKSATHDLLLFTDADCMPVGRNWIKNMASNFSSKTQIVLGYSPYRKSGGLLNMFIRFETFMTGLLYMSFAMSKDAYMGVGRNLAYRRSLFFSVKGFANHNHMISGDDDLFVNETADGDNVAVELRKDSFMISEPKKTIEEWRRQKSRHMSTGKMYKGRHKFWLSLFSISHILFYVFLPACLVMLIFYGDIEKPIIPMINFVSAILGIYLMRGLIMTVIYYPAMKKMNDNTLALLLPLLDILYSFYLAIFGIIGIFSKPKTWN